VQKDFCNKIDPHRTKGGLKSRSAAVSCRSRGVLSFLSEGTGGIGQ
jgi:hypothetical protein